METVVANVRGKVRRVTRDGREYLVAPVSMIVPGVLAGSKGPLYYPPDEISANPSIWNKTPIVVYHPTCPLTNRPLSASDKGVMERSGIGFVEGSKAKGKLVGEGWFDVEHTKRVDPRVYESLKANKPLELSTGLYTDNELAPVGSRDPKGRPYTFVARNYRPDHLAILPDQIGACSIKDGCGVLVNSSSFAPVILTPLNSKPTFRITPMRRSLTNNCGCKKKKMDWRPLSNAFCPTGPGGGVDATCSPGGSGGSTQRSFEEVTKDIKTLITKKGFNLMNPKHQAAMDKLRAEQVSARAAESKSSESTGTKSSDFGGKGGKKPSSEDVKNLSSKLGKDTKFTGGQIENDPGVSAITSRGEKISGSDKIKLSMKDGECHWNTAKAYDEGKVDSIVIGYTKHPDNGGAWHQHTWGMKDGKVVETTSSNNSNTDYFGMKLNKEESAAFVSHAKAVKPGEGKMRATSSLTGNSEWQSIVTKDTRKKQPWLSYNAFCPTGPGGGVDATCSPGGSGGSSPGGDKESGKDSHADEHKTFGGIWKGKGKVALEENLPTAALDLAKAVGATVGHTEHILKELATTAIGKGVSKLPPVAQTVVKGAFVLGKLGGAAAFATWTATQALAERVAKERGATDEQAKALRSTLSAADIWAAKPVILGAEHAHLAAPILLAASLVPPVTAGYLAYSTARNPAATYRAATGLVSDTAKSVLGGISKAAGRLKSVSEKATGYFKQKSPYAAFSHNQEWTVINAGPSFDPSVTKSTSNEDQANLIADGLEAHGYDQWYIALLFASLEHTQDVKQSIALADQTYKSHPKDTSSPQEDDLEAVLGDKAMKALSGKMTKNLSSIPQLMSGKLPKCGDTGKWMTMGSGTGRGEAHAAAKKGHKDRAEEDEEDRSPNSLMGEVNNRDWSQKKRDKLPTKDFAGPDQSFPITTQEDVDSAAKLIGKASDPESVKKNIIKIAKRRGLSIPDAWKEDNSVGNRRIFNNNPEGINQYTGGGGGEKPHETRKTGTYTEPAKTASAKANKASDKANEVGTKKEHEKAAKLHEKASDQYKVSIHYNPNAPRPHETAALEATQYHRDKAKEHWGKSFAAQNSSNDDWTPILNAFSPVLYRPEDLLTNAELGVNKEFGSDAERRAAFAAMSEAGTADKGVVSTKGFTKQEHTGRSGSESKGSSERGVQSHTGREGPRSVTPKASTPKVDPEKTRVAGFKSADAVKATGLAKKVNKDRQPKYHGRAAVAHTAAAQAHAEAGNTELAESHTKAAAEHRAKSDNPTANRLKRKGWSTVALAFTM